MGGLIEIGGVRIGDGRPCYVIAEIGLNHNGSLEIAKKLIDVAAVARVSAVKFQKRNVETLAIGDVLDAEDLRFPEFGRTYREVRAHLEFGDREYRELIAYAAARNLTFLCTPFDVLSLEFLQRFELAAYKIASHSITNLPLLEAVARAGRPVIMSTGMCVWEELDAAVAVMLDTGVPLAILHCVSAYPQADEDANLALLESLKIRYGVPVGYSGHETNWLATLLAVSKGARLIERHVTLSREMVGFDHRLSLEPNQLVRLVGDIRRVERMEGSCEKRILDREWQTRRKYHVSIVARRHIEPGERITSEMLTFKNPGTGLPPTALQQVVGRLARRPIPADSLILLDVLE